MSDAATRYYLPRRPLFPIALSVISGGLVGGVVDSLVDLGWVGFALVVAYYAFVDAGKLSRLRRGMRLIVMLAAFVLAIGYATLNQTRGDDDIAFRYPDGAKEITLEGTVRKGTPSVTPVYDPSVERDLPKLFQGRDIPYRSFLLNVELAGGKPASGSVRVFIARGEDVRAGNRVRVKGQIKGSRIPTNPGEFDSRDSAARHGISAALFTKKAADLEILDYGRSMRGEAEGYRDFVWFKVGKDLDPGNDSLLAAMALGERSTLSHGTRESFMRTGTVHMLVVSGLHVFVMVWVVGYLLRFVGVKSFRWRELARVLIAMAFLIVSGGHIATLRAVVMISLFSLATLRGRGHEMLNSLAFAALVVFLLEPLDVTSEGFALSFITVLAFIVTLPLLKKRDVDPEERESLLSRENILSQTVRSTLVASIVAMPLVVYRWNVMTPAAVLVNVLSVVLIFGILGASIFLPLAGIPLVAAILVWFFNLMIGVLRVIVEFSAGVEGAAISITTPSFLWVVLAYLAVGAGTWIFSRPIPKRIWIGLLPILIIYSSVSFFTPSPPPSPEVVMLDMRHGNAILLRTPEGQNILVDCGAQSRPQVGSGVVADALLAQGVRKLDLLVLTHADRPSVNGVATLLKRISVERIWVSEDFARSEEGRDALLWLRAEGQNLEEVSIGDSETFGECQLKVLWPGPVADFDALSTRRDRDDVTSMVLLFSQGENDALITGGIDDLGLKTLLSELPEAEILIAPKNGGKLTRAEELVAKVKPELVLISTRPGFVKKPSLDAYASGGAKLLQTSEGGAIFVPLNDPESARQFDD